MQGPEVERLLIDRSPAQRLTEADVAEWASDQAVFISSVMEGMQAERQAVADAVVRVGAEPVLFERLGGRDDGPQVAYRDGVSSSDIYVGILGGATASRT